MKTKPLTAAQIDKHAQRLSETPIKPSASPKKAGDDLARLLAAQIGDERAALAFTAILSATTFEQVEAHPTLVLDYGNTEPAAEVPADITPATSDHAVALVVGKGQTILDQAQVGALPQVPDFSRPTYARFRTKLAQIVALAEAGDIAALQAFEINPVSSSPKAMARYRDLCAIAITARAQVTA